MKRSGPLQRRTPLRRNTGLKRAAPLKRAPLKRGRSLKRSGRRPETAAHKQARLFFDAEVIAKGLCFFADVNLAGEPRRPRHVCGGELDAHHLIAKSWIQRHFGDLPEDELLAIKYATLIGCPLCRCAHDALPANLKPGDRVFFEELDPDLWVEPRVDGEQQVLSSTWEPNAAERADLAAGANVELLVWGQGQPPVFVGVTRVLLGKPPVDGERDVAENPDQDRPPDDGLLHGDALDLAMSSGPRPGSEMGICETALDSRIRSLVDDQLKDLADEDQRADVEAQRRVARHQ